MNELYDSNVSQDEIDALDAAFRDDELWQEGDTTVFGDEVDFDEQEYLTDLLEDTFIEDFDEE